MNCPKCNNPMEKDSRASDDKRTIWLCLWKNCQHVARIPTTKCRTETETALIEVLKHIEKEAYKAHCDQNINDKSALYGIAYDARVGLESVGAEIETKISGRI